MSNTIIFRDVEIPGIVMSEESYEVIGEFWESENGELHQTVDGGVRRTWTITIEKITSEEANTLISLFLSTYFGPGNLTLPHLEFPIQAYPRVESNRVTPFGRGGEWHSDGRTITIKFFEKGGM